MFILYNGNGSGSLEVRRVNKVHDVKSQLIVRHATRVLRLVGHNGEAAELLDAMPFELWEATNGFGDQFCVLYMKIPVGKYLDIEREADSHRSKTLYGTIALALEQAGNPVRFIGMEANTDDAPGTTISTPLLETTSLAVSRALNDFEVLVNSSGGPISGLDRIHTALHGHLRVICNEATIPYSEDADLAALFGLIRKHHPKLQSLAPELDGTKILRGLAGILDALSPVRNRHSMAHPNEVLLEEPEARLAVNAAKSVLHYLDAKLQ
jgi:hypothetical protein